MMKQKRKLSLFGVPGAGKGTQAELLTNHLSIPHISTGDMFRALQDGHTELAHKIKGILASGALVPDSLVTEMAFERLERDDCKAGYLLDGFPRTLPQAMDLQASKFAIDCLIEIKVDRKEIVRRLAGRRLCQVCGAIYHIDFLAGATDCKLGHGPLLQRADDMPKAIEIRLEAFEANVAPVLDFF